LYSGEPPKRKVVFGRAAEEETSTRESLENRKVVLSKDRNVSVKPELNALSSCSARRL